MGKTNKDLTTLGNYIAALIGNNFNAAARIMDISAAELYALRKGSRQNPSPNILLKIAETFKGDYNLMMELCGYVPPRQGSPDCIKLPIINEIYKGEKIEEKITGFYTIPAAWKGDFAFVEDCVAFENKKRVSVIEKREHKEGDSICVAWELNQAATMQFFSFDHTSIELVGLVLVFRQQRIKTSEYTVFGVVNRIIYELDGCL